MKAIGLIVLLLLATFVTPSFALAAGGGAMSSPSVAPSQPKKTPQEKAIESYNRGIAARDRANKMEEKLDGITSKRKAANLQKRITRKYLKAAKNFRRAIAYEPQLYQAHGSLGYALKQLGDLDNAMIAYDECLKLKPDYTPAIEYRAEAYLGLGRFNEVMKAHKYLGSHDKGHQKELEAAIASWLGQNEKNKNNARFHSWAKKLSSASS